MRTHLFRMVSILSVAAAVWTACGPRASLAQALDPRFGGDIYGGDGAGWTNGYNSFDWFQPITATAEDITFMEWRALIEHDSGVAGNNFGGGYRMYAPGADRMFGFYGFYDVRDSGSSVFHQGSIGAETVGPNWIARTNLYVPIKPPERTTFLGVFTDPFFQGNNIVQTRTRIFQTALPGADVEFGMPLPVPFGMTLYGGTYCYLPSGANNETEFGWRTRLETRVSDNITAMTSLQGDNLFGVTFNFGLAWYWRGFTPRLGFGGVDATCGTGYQRLATPIWRQTQVAVHDRAITETRTLTAINCVLTDNPVTPEDDRIVPVRVVHVRNNAVGSGNSGTFEDPLTELALANAVSQQGDIIFVNGTPNDTTGQDRGITLQSGQRLLAGGFVHYIDTIQLGTIQLPGFDPAQAGQTITNTVATSTIVDVTGANTFEISGFNIINSRGSAIANNPQGGSIDGHFDRADNCYGISINRNNIVDFAGQVPGNTGAGIFLTNAFGDVRIGAQDPRDAEAGNPAVPWGNFINGHPDGGIIINKVQPQSDDPNALTDDTNLIIANNTITRNSNGVPNPGTATFPLLSSDNGVTIIAANEDDAVPGASFINAILDNNIIAFNRPLLTSDDTIIDGQISNGVYLLASDAARISTLISNHNRVDVGSPNSPGNAVFNALATGATGISFNANNGIFMRTEAPNNDTIVPTINLAVTMSNAEIAAQNPGFPGAASRGIANNVINFNGTTFATAVRGDGIHAETTDESQQVIDLTGGGGIHNNISIDNNFRNGIFLSGLGTGGIPATSVSALIDSNTSISNNGRTVVGVTPASTEGSGIAAVADEQSILTLTVTNNTAINNNLVDGVFASAIGDATSMTVNVTGNTTINGNGRGLLFAGAPIGNGVHVEAIDDSQVQQLNIEDNGLISNNSNNGVFISIADDVDVNSVSIDNNTIINNGTINGNNDPIGDGVRVISTGSSSFNQLSVTNNPSISNNLLNGVFMQIETDDPTAQFVNINNNLAINNNGGFDNVLNPVGDGVIVTSLGSTNFGGLNVNNNTSISNNGRHGVFLNLTSDDVSAQFVSVSGNGLITGNGDATAAGAPVGDGIRVQTQGSVVLGTLNINNNALVGGTFRDPVTGISDGNAEHGIFVSLTTDQGVGSPQLVNINNNNVNFNGRNDNQSPRQAGDGIHVQTQGSTFLSQLNINNNPTINNNFRHGVFVLLNTDQGGPAAQQQVSITGNGSISNNGFDINNQIIGDGINLTTLNNTNIHLDIRSNPQISDNFGNGIFVESQGTSLITGGIGGAFGATGNQQILRNGTFSPIANRSIGNGIFIGARGTSTINMDAFSGVAGGADQISGNVINGSTLNGILAVKDTGANLRIGIVDNVIIGTGVAGQTNPPGNNNGIRIDSNGGTSDSFRGVIDQNARLDPLGSGEFGISRHAEDGVQVNLASNGGGAIVPDLQITNNSINNNGSNNIEVNDTGTGNVIVIANNNTTTVRNAGLNGIVVNAGRSVGGTLGGSAGNYTISGNRVVASGTAASRLALGLPPLPANTTDGNGIVFNPFSSNNVVNITGNGSYNNLRYGIVIGQNPADAALAGTGNVYTINDNNMVDIAANFPPPNTGLTGVAGNGLGGIYFNNRADNNDVTISGNVVTGNGANATLVNDGHGIFINNQGGANNSDVTISGNTVQGNGTAGPPPRGDGIAIINNGTGNDYTLNNNIVGGPLAAQGNRGNGISLVNTVNMDSLSLNNQTNVQNNGLNGLLVQTNGGTVTSLQVNNNTNISNNGTSAAGGSGINVQVNGGTVTNLQINNNQGVNTNGAGLSGNGITLSTSGAGVMTAWQINGNGTAAAPITGNFGDGIRVNLASGNNLGGVIDGNFTSANGATVGGNGINVQNNATGNVLTISNNSSNNHAVVGANTGNGILYQASAIANGSSITVTGNGNGVVPAISGNANNGIQVDIASSSPAAQTISITNNRVTANGTAGGTAQSGILFNLTGNNNNAPGFVITGNNVFDNIDDGITANISGNGNIGVISNNLITGAGGVQDVGVLLNVTGATNTIDVGDGVNGGNTITGQLNDGIRNTISGASNSIRMNANTIGGATAALGNDGDGIDVQLSGTANNNTVNIGGLQSNTIQNQNLNGVLINTAATGINNAITVANSTITFNGQGGVAGSDNGVLFTTTAGAAATTVNVTGSTIQDNTGHGVSANLTTNGNTFRVQNNLSIRSNDNGVNLTIAGSNNSYSISGNTVGDPLPANGNRDNGINISITGNQNNATDINDNVVNGNGADGTGNGIVFTTAAGATGNNINNMLRNNVTNNSDNGVVFTLGGSTSNVTFSLGTVTGNGAAGAAAGIDINVTGATNNVTLLGNNVSTNTGDGINYTQASGVATNTFIVSSDPLAVAIPTTASTIGGNTDDGLEITLTSGVLRTQVYGNQFTPSNGDRDFLITSNAGTDLGLQFLHNVAQGGGGGNLDYRFVQNAAGTFRFENPFFDEAAPFPLYQAGTNQPGDFQFTGFLGTEDVALGTFFPDPGAPY